MLFGIRQTIVKSRVVTLGVRADSDDCCSTSNMIMGAS